MHSDALLWKKYYVLMHISTDDKNIISTAFVRMILFGIAHSK